MILTSWPATKQIVSWLYLDGNLYRGKSRLIPITLFYLKRKEYYPYVFYGILN